jgi:gamma-glutamyltranspeptidase/glutathione hydrolase
MTPTIVFKTKGNGLTEKRPVMATGSPGGSTIITVVLQNVLNHLEFGMNIAEATAAPRIHHQWLPDEVFVEPGISKDTLQMLQAMGHKIQNERRVLGRVQAISCSEASSTESNNNKRQLSGTSDTRWPGGEATPSD